jgi:hypothetical protein
LPPPTGPGGPLFPALAGGLELFGDPLPLEPELPCPLFAPAPGGGDECALPPPFTLGPGGGGGGGGGPASGGGPAFGGGPMSAGGPTLGTGVTVGGGLTTGRGDDGGGGGGRGGGPLESPKAFPWPLPPFSPKALPLPFPPASAAAGEWVNAIAAQAQSSGPRRTRGVPQPVQAKCPIALLSPRGDAHHRLTLMDWGAERRFSAQGKQNR